MVADGALREVPEVSTRLPHSPEGDGDGVFDDISRGPPG